MRKLMIFLFTCVFSLFLHFFYNYTSGKILIVSFPVTYAAEMEETMEEMMKESLCKVHRHKALLFHPALGGVILPTYKYDKGYEWCRDYLLKKKKETN